MATVDYARALKVAAILAKVRAAGIPDNDVDRARMAQVLESWPQADRDVFAASAGQRSPSRETWRQVVAAVRAHRTDNEMGRVSAGGAA
jgi:hypothetical protein